MSSVDRIFLTVISAAPVGAYRTDFAFSIAVFIAAGELTTSVGTSPRKPNATGTLAIWNRPGTILPAASNSSSTSGSSIATSKSWPLRIVSFKLPRAEPYSTTIGLPIRASACLSTALRGSRIAAVAITRTSPGLASATLGPVNCALAARTGKRTIAVPMIAVIIFIVRSLCIVLSCQMRNLWPLSARLAADRGARQAHCPWLHHECVFERIPGAGDVGNWCRSGFVAYIIADEAARHAELRIGFEKLVVLHVDLRDQRLEAFAVCEEMQVRRPHIVPALCTQEIADRAVDRDRVAGGFHAAKRDMTVLVGDEYAAQIHVGLHRILVLVKSFRRGMPDFDFRAFDRIAAVIPEPRFDEQGGARCRRAHDRGAVFHAWRIGPPEGAEQIGIGLDLAALAVVEEADQLRKAERARHQHDFVMTFGGLLAERRHISGGGLEFLLGEFHLTREIVKVAYECRHDLLEAPRRCALQLRQNGRGHVFFCFDDHRVLVFRVGCCSGLTIEKLAPIVQSSARHCSVQSQVCDVSDMAGDQVL